jgi:hypothetical protein
MSSTLYLIPKRLLRKIALGTKAEQFQIKMKNEKNSLKKHVENYANKSNIRVSNTNMKFLLNKVKNNYMATTDEKKRYLTRLMDNMRFPPMFSENIKRKTNKNRKIIRKKGNTTKSRLSK